MHKPRANIGTKEPNPVDVEVGRRIRARRLANGMSQTALAQRLGVTFQQVQKYEKGVNRVGAGRLQHIARVLQVPITFFFEDSTRRSDGASEPPTSGFEFLNTARSLRMIKAFSRIRNSRIQDALADLCETVAGPGKK